MWAESPTADEALAMPSLSKAFDGRFLAGVAMDPRDIRGLSSNPSEMLDGKFMQDHLRFRSGYKSVSVPEQIRSSLGRFRRRK